MTIAIAVSFVLIFAWSLRTENQKLAAIEMARAEVAEFKKLADEAQYFAATSGRLDDSTPYYDPVVAERVAGDAIRISDAWGDHLEGLPLDVMRSSVKETLYSLLLTTVQSQLNRNMDSELIEKSRSLLARASTPPRTAGARLRMEPTAPALRGLPPKARGAGELRTANSAHASRHGAPPCVASELGW